MDGDKQFRSELRRKLYTAIVGEDLTQGDDGRPLELPLDAIVAELGYAMATFIAVHPGMQTPESRRAAIERLAKGIELHASTLSNQKDWALARCVIGAGNA